MANTESDVTYCSEAEKENLSQIRRSKRLSQKKYPNFRYNGDPNCQRLEDIYHMLTGETSCNWTRHDWLALKFEVELLKNSGVQSVLGESKIDLVEKTIQQRLQKFKTPIKGTGNFIKSQNEGRPRTPPEPIKSPNVLAGMTTEFFTEIPPYQPVYLAKKMEVNQNLNANLQATQANPLDLTKKVDQGHQVPKSTTQTLVKDCHSKIKDKSKEAVTSVSKDSLIDLTTEEDIEDKENIPPPKAKSESTQKDAYTSKWLKFLPTQQKPKASTVTSKAPSPVRGKQKTLKESLRNLYKENASLSTNKTNKSREQAAPDKIPPKTKTSCNPKVFASQTRTKETTKSKPFRHTESARNLEPNNLPIRAFDLSPNFSDISLPWDSLALDDDGNSESSLTLSLKKDLKRVFGTDDLRDVIGCEKIVYSLTENHIDRLANLLKMQKTSLKRKIEQAMADDSKTVLEDDRRSSSSEVPCSQSPTQRLFPSQRSQISK